MEASRNAWFMASALMVTAALGCGDDGDEPEHQGNPPADGGGHFAMIPCPDDLPEFGAGLRAMGESERVQAELIDAQYVPARQFRNDWTVAFLDPDGEPLDDVEITMAEAFMPEHNHDGRFPPVWEMLDEAGEFQVDDINLWMTGPWEVRFWVSSPSGGDDYIVFDVCIE